MFFKKRCQHQWVMLSEKTTVSKFEGATEVMGDAYSSVKIPHQMCCMKRKFIQIISCTKCGGLKRFVEDI